ncbi:MAG: hypothetical protein HC933_01440 [Pleurocapsa sp. SU_196_0]|nr:hypothetical protein [Pleurocapsa sp. SU_196_0]
MRKLVFCILLLGTAFASSVPRELKTEAEVASVILSARREVLIVAPNLYSREIANAVRRVLVEGQTPVRILADSSLVSQRGGFVATLALLSTKTPSKPARPIEVRVLEGIDRANLVVDGSRTVSGPLVTETWTIGLLPTYFTADTSEAQRRLEVFKRNWAKAKPWSYSIQNPRFKPKP